MSDQVIANPEHMRDFARSLNAANQQLADLMNGLSARLSNLGESWRDHHFDQFKDTFEQAAHSLNRFLDESERYVHYLNQKADPLERYEQVRVP